MQGKIVKGISGFYYVHVGEPGIYECKEKGVKVYAAHLKGTDNSNQKDYAQPTAFMIGNEGNGLSDRLTQKADELVRIPMQGKVESLNAAIACTILTYEAVRQRL